MNNNYNNIAIGLRSQYQAALFIDNAQSHMEQMAMTCNRGMTLIKVGETPNLQPSLYSAPYMDLYARAIGPENTYSKAVRKLSNREFFDPASGIQESHLPLIEKWINDTANVSPRAMLFDWDRTITIIEGVYVKPNGMKELHEFMVARGYDMSDLPAIYAEDALVYLCGGKDRLTMLRTIMKSCVELNIDIIFLTNNGGCNPEQNGGLRELMDGLVPPGTPYQVICSIHPPYFGDKGKAFRDEMPDKSSLICLKSMGGHRRSKKTRKIKRRKSRSASRKSYK
jgi:hypothetical protein